MHAGCLRKGKEQVWCVPTGKCVTRDRLMREYSWIKMEIGMLWEAVQGQCKMECCGPVIWWVKWPGNFHSYLTGNGGAYYQPTAVWCLLSYCWHIVEAGICRYAWLNRKTCISLCVSDGLLCAMGYIKTVFLRQNKSSEINTFLSGACLCWNSGVEISKEVGSHFQQAISCVFVHSYTGRCLHDHACTHMYDWMWVSIWTNKLCLFKFWLLIEICDKYPDFYN